VPERDFHELVEGGVTTMERLSMALADTAPVGYTQAELDSLR